PRLPGHRMDDGQFPARRRGSGAAGAGGGNPQVQCGRVSKPAMSVVSVRPRKIDVKPEWWDNIFAPSSCLVLITTVDREGNVNAAAFGTCTRVCHEPMYIAFTCSADKDTTINALATGEFVVNVVPFEQAVLDKVPVCGLPFRPGVNELEKAGLTAIPARVLRPSRIAECRAHFECRVEWTRAWLYRVMICGRVEAVSIDDGCMDANGFIIWDKVKPAHYCGMRYQDRFVPAYDKPTRGNWRYQGRDAEVRPGEDWRKGYPRGDLPRQDQRARKPQESAKEKAQDKQKEIAFFDGHAGTDAYDVFTPQASARLVDAFVRLSGLKPSMRVADLGCGSGAFTALLARAGYDCVGVDISPKLIEVGRRKYPDIEFAEGDIEHLPFPDASFDG